MGIRNLRSDRLDSSRSQDAKACYMYLARINKVSAQKSAHPLSVLHDRSKNQVAFMQVICAYKIQKSHLFRIESPYTHRYKCPHLKVPCRQLQFSRARSTNECRARESMSLSLWPLRATVIIDDCLSSRRTVHAPLLYRKPARHALDSRPFARKRNHAVCACAALGGLCGSPSGIAPFWEHVSSVRRRGAVV